MMEFQYCHECQTIRPLCLLGQDGAWHCMTHQQAAEIVHDPAIEAQLSDLAELTGDLSILLDKNDPQIWADMFRRELETRREDIAKRQPKVNARAFRCRDCSHAYDAVAYWFFMLGPLCEGCFKTRVGGMNA